MKIRNTAARLVVGLIVGIGCWASASLAEDYPSRTITAVVPYPAGGPSDVVARIVADSMSRVLNHTMVIENVGGAGGTLGTARVATAAPDGYTLLAASMGSHVAAPALTPNLRYDSTKDFEPIGLTSNAPVAVVARKDFAAGNFKEFLAQVKAQGESVKQAHGGIGSSSHMACLLFTAQFGIKPKPIPYRGTGPALNDLIGGHVDFFCEQVVSVAPAVTGQKIKAYVVSGNTRSPALPDVPTAQQAGQAEFKLSIWSAMFAPKGTPKDVVAKLAGALDQALDDPALAQRLAELGGSVPAKAERGPAHLGNLLRTDIARLDPILKAAAADAK